MKQITIKIFFTLTLGAMCLQVNIAHSDSIDFVEYDSLINSLDGNCNMLYFRSKQHPADAHKGYSSHGINSTEQQITQLKKRIRKLELEKEILKKSRAIFPMK